MILNTFLVVGVTVLVSYIATKGVYRKIDNHAIFTKILNEGLYHFTSEESCKKIVESGYVKASSRYLSYSPVKKSFFFAGIPSFEDMAINIGVLASKPKLTAVKIKPTFEQLASFRYRELNDDAVVYDGNCNIDDKNVSIAYIVADLDKNGHIQYKEVDKKNYDNYVPSKKFQELANEAEKNKLGFTMKAIKTNMKHTYEKCTNILKQKLHRMKLIKYNTYANKTLKTPFNFKESIRQEISDSIEILRHITMQKQENIDMDTIEPDNRVGKVL